MKKEKMRHRLLYGFMSLLLMIQAFMPLIAVAETVSPDWQLGALEEKDAQLNLAVNIPEGKEAVFRYSNLDVSEVSWASGKTEPKLTLDVDKNEIHIEKADKAREDKLVLHGASGDQTVTISYNDQKAVWQPAVSSTTNSESQATTESSQEATTATTESTGESEVAQTTATTDSSASTESTSSSTTSSTDATEKSDSPKDKKAPAKAKAAEGTDIRTYFPDGEGTILTDSNILFTDKDGKPLTPPIPADATVRLTYDWEIPEDVRKQIKAGDYFAFHLPAELVPNREMSGALKDSEGHTYATYFVGKDGTVRFTFTEDVTESSDIKGDFYFESHFETNHIDGPGDITIHYPTEDDLPPVDVVIRPATETEIDKQGQFDRTPNPSQVEWTVDINQAMKDHTNLKVTENWPDGIDYRSVDVYELVMNLDGTVKEVGTKLPADAYTVDDNGNVTIKGKTNKAYRLVYQTDIADSAIPDKGGKVHFENEAVLTSDELTDGISAEATVTNNYGKLIEKDKAGYDSKNQEFSWEIKYNYGEKNIRQDQAILTDTMSDNLAFEPDSLVVHKVTFDKDGNEIIGDALKTPDDYVVEFDEAENKFVLKFQHDIDYAVKIDYKTKVDTLVTDDTNVDNKVVVDTGGDGQESGSDGTAVQQNIVKSLGKPDYANKTVDWTLEVNKNGYYMEDAVITDTFSPVPGLWLTPSHTTETKYQLTIETADGTELFAPEDYELQVQTNEHHQEMGFTIKLKGRYAQTEEHLIIRYTTDFDVSDLDPDGKTGPDSFLNHAGIDWTDKDGNKQHSEDEKPFKPHDPFSLNAEKGGVYNAVTKEITWTVIVNLSANQLTGAKLTDPILDNQAYVSGSVKVYKAQTNPDGSVHISGEAVNEDMPSIVEPKKENNHTLTVDFPEGIAQTYAVIFKTSLADKVIDGSASYNNVADYTNGGDDRKVTGKVSIQHGGESVQKDGVQDPDDPNYVLWHLMINGAQSTLDDVVITDQPSINQVLDEKSVTIYATKVDADGNITPDRDHPLTVGEDYTVELATDNATGQQTLTVKMAHIETAYYMEYRSLILSSVTGKQDTVSNNVHISGTGSKVIEGDDGKDVLVQVDNSGGSANGQRGRIVIQKTSEDGRTPLTGAHFQLWDLAQEHVLREGTVDEQGRIIFGGLPYGDYKLVETVAPAGYTISDELVAGKTVTVSADSSAEAAQPLVVVNEPNKVILKKIDEQKNTLIGARFKLEQLTTEITGSSFWKEVPLQNDQTDRNGLLEVDHLAPGLYRFVEIFAPDGFILNESPHVFFVYEESNGQIPEVDITMINYRGSASLVKEDTEGNGLEGAEFKVVDAKGQDVPQQLGLESDAEGHVTAYGLAPGNYQFVETKAPSGYVLNTTPIPFTIDSEHSGKPNTVVAAEHFKNYQGSARLVKKDATGNPLKDAEFAVLTSEGAEVASGLVSNEKGEVTVNGLAPGHYQFKETKAPTGYLLNDTLQPFEISGSAAGEPTVVDAGTFTDYQGAFKIRKVDSQGQELSGAEFTLLDEDQQPVEKATSDSQGQVTFSKLAPGIYYFQETKAPQNHDGAPYILNPALIKVVIPDHYTGDPQVFDMGDFQNFKGKAVITKVGSAGSVAGATFELSRIVNGEEQLVRTITVPKTGELDLDDLGVGSYKLVETKAAPGYVLNSQPIYFVVQAEGTTDITDEMDFTNYQVEVVGRKVNEDGTALAGAKFAIYVAKDGKAVGDPLTVQDREGHEVQEIISNEAGEIYAKGLPVGKYVLVETAAAAGYLKETTPQAFEVTPQLGNPEPIELGDFVNYRGSVLLEKTDDTGNRLAGAVFDVVNDAGTTVATKLTSDENGQVSVTDLAPGNYQFIETQAPTGYIRNTTPVSFTIEKESAGKPNTIRLKMINYQGSVIWQKTDETGKVLAGAVFEVTHQGKKIATVVSDENGQVTLAHLAPGAYTVEETKAPEGYQLQKAPVNFEITAAAAGEPEQIVLQPIINRAIPAKPKTDNKTPRKPDQYPATNEQSTSLYFVLGIALIGLAVFISWKKKKN